MMIRTCVIVSNTVTTTCPPAPPPAPPAGASTTAAAAAEMCMPATGMNFAPIPPQHLSISGTLTVRTVLFSFCSTTFCKQKWFVQTSNIIMANWSREMWQSVVNRVLRMTTSGPFRTHFATAFATVI
ncbi:hypothetical protein KIN20_007319 [Parelaphostrongylus tenuis]|uniref:Uncharacterized protein n=1 Tax=Parelaphostrongylus tenuis TaxID=148309 RepID=A0AAD5M7W7_PARTN|nr:hypothetical protein KIN20_007319 [Parelaphostrongylus tenuis]